MTVKELLTSGIDILSEVHICYYDGSKDDTITLTELEAWNKSIEYMYVNGAEIWLEVEN